MWCGCVVLQPIGVIQLQLRWNHVEKHRVCHSDNLIILLCRVLSRKEYRVPLSNRNVEQIRFGRLRVHAIDLHDGEVVVFNVKVLCHKCSNVEKPQQVCRVRLDRNTYVQRVVEQEGVGNRLRTGRVVQRQEIRRDVLDQLVVPVAYGHDYLLVVLILEIRVGVVDEEGLAIAIWVAEIGVAVVPVRPVLRHREVVGEVRSRRNWTLGNHVRPVHVVGSDLVHAVKMDGGISVQPVVHVDHQLVALLHLDDGQRPPTVYAHDLPLRVAIGVAGDPTHVEIVRDCLRRAPPAEQQQGHCPKERTPRPRRHLVVMSGGETLECAEFD